MGISNDFLIDINNKIISHQEGSTTVYTVNQLYSYLRNYFDDLMLLSFPIPISAQTPTEYSIINGWYFHENSLPYLSSGALKTLGYDATLFIDGIFVVKFEELEYIQCSETDIGKRVTNLISTGILLNYDNLLRKWWVRKIDGIDWSGTISIIDGNGSGNSISYITGENVYANIYTLGELEPSTQNNLYIEQINPDLIDNKIPAFWNSEHIDILLKVQEAGILIDSGNVAVYVREYGNLFSHYKTNLASGGRTPVPLSTLSDSNNTTAKEVVATWSDVTVTFGNYTYSMSDGIDATYFAEIDCGNRDNIQQVYERLKYITSSTYTGYLKGSLGSFYKSASENFRDNIQAPFGSYIGNRFYGARGIWLKNVPYNDSNNYQVIDTDNIIHLPKFVAICTVNFDMNLVGNGTSGVYRVFFKQISIKDIGSCKFGDINASLVTSINNTQISGNISQSSITFDFDYDGNVVSKWTPSHTYILDDEFHNGSTWYRVIGEYTTGLQFGNDDITNTIVIDGPTIVLVGISDTAQYASIEGTIHRTVENIYSISSSPELNYIP